MKVWLCVNGLKDAQPMNAAMLGLHGLKSAGQEKGELILLSLCQCRSESVVKTNIRRYPNLFAGRAEPAE